MDPEGIYGGKEGAGLPPKAPLREPGQRVNAVNGIERGAASVPLADTPLDDDPIPVPKHHCDHCGSATGITYPYDWPGRPDGIRLHGRCEAPWFDSHKPAPRLVCESPSDLR